MNWLEILLIIWGAAAFIGSFIMKGKPEETNEPVQVDPDIIKTLVNREMEDAKERVEAVVDETLQYAVEKTERASERISNEKIMAINEYSETVLADINKSHQEVLFLYDMLNNKHDEIKETVKQVDKASKELAKELEEEKAKQKNEKTVDIAENDKNSVEKNLIEKKPIEKKSIEKSNGKNFEVYSFTEQAPHIVRNEQATNNKPKATNIIPLEQAMANQAKAEQAKVINPVVEEPEEVTEVENVIVEMKPEAKVNTVSAFSVVAAENKDEENVEIIEIADNAQDTTQQPENNNDRILQMHKEGMSNVDIAKELGLGVGEVKLVINLFKGAM
jgi:hypothetical protein